MIFIVDDEGNVRESLRAVFQEDGRKVEDYESAEAFLAGYQPGRDGCLLVDAYLPGISALELLRRLRAHGVCHPS